MGFLRNLFGKKETTSPANKSSEQYYYFIGSGNASLIEFYNDMFKKMAAADSKASKFIETPAHYRASVSTLSAREQEAHKSSLTFEGQSIMGPIGAREAKSTPITLMHQILFMLRLGATKEVHLAFVAVNQSGVPWVQKVHAEFLNQAISQGILPYEMYVTKDKDAARSLLGSFKKVS
jgi:hypothetical protein